MTSSPPSLPFLKDTFDEKQPLATSTPPDTELDPTPKQFYTVELSCLAVLCLVLGLFIIFGNPILAYQRWMLDPATDTGRCIPPAEHGHLPGLGHWAKNGNSEEGWSGMHPRRWRQAGFN